MKVVLINHSDTRGGASVVTLRLTESLRAIGIDAKMLVGHKEGLSPLVVEGSQWCRRLSFVAEHLDIVAHNKLSRKNLFKISTARFGMGLHKHPLVKEADIVVLAWVNQGTMSLSEIDKIAQQKPVVWVMHDRWCQTGVCHHVPENCQRLNEGCDWCPLLQTPSASDLSHKVFRAKQQLYKSLPYPALSFVAVSSWLKEVGSGGIIEDKSVEVIPNAFPVENYAYEARKTRAELGLPEGPLVLMGAARLDDPIKNLPLAIKALNAVQMPATAVFFGAVKDSTAFDRLQIPYVYLGSLNSSQEVADIMSHASVVISSSLFETLPTTLIEGMAAGATPVTTGNGGQRDIIDDGIDGYIVPENDHKPNSPDPQAATMAMLIDRALAMPFDRTTQHHAVERRFAAKNIAKRYVALFERVIADFAKNKA